MLGPVQPELAARQSEPPQYARLFNSYRRQHISARDTRQTLLESLQTAEFRTVFAFKIATLYENLQLIEFNEDMRRRAVVMCLINNKRNIENALISKGLGTPIRTIQDIRKELKRSGDPE